MTAHRYMVTVGFQVDGGPNHADEVAIDLHHWLEEKLRVGIDDGTQTPVGQSTLVWVNDLGSDHMDSGVCPGCLAENVHYEQCAHCHLFVVPNDQQPGVAEDCSPYLHLHRGDVHDEALDATHMASPSGEVHALSWWKEHGPPAMRARFDPLTHGGDA